MDETIAGEMSQPSPETVVERLIAEDGLHRFPGPIVDWSNLAPRVRVRGVSILDDVPIPSARVVHGYMEEAPELQLAEIVGHRAAAFRKFVESPAADQWRRQPFNRARPDLSYLPLVHRTAMWTSAPDTPPGTTETPRGVMVRHVAHLCGTPLAARTSASAGRRGARLRKLLAVHSRVPARILVGRRAPADTWGAPSRAIYLA